MTTANVQFKLTVQEASVIAEALQHYRKFHAGVSRMKQVADEERKVALGNALQAESILRAMGFQAERVET